MAVLLATGIGQVRPEPIVLVKPDLSRVHRREAEILVEQLVGERSKLHGRMLAYGDAMTENIAATDAYARNTTATVVSSGPDGVVLDRTVFYPGGGGQPADTGLLRTDAAAWTVTGARKAGGAIVHAVEPAPDESLPPLEQLRASTRAYVGWIDERRESYVKLIESTGSVPEVRELILEPVERSDLEVAPVEGGHRARHWTQHLGGVTPLEQQLLHGSSGSLFEDQGSVLAPVGDRPHHGEAVPALLFPFLKVP